jgi:hypothetical protein
LLKLILKNFEMFYRTMKSLVFRPLIRLKSKIYTRLNIRKFLNKISKFLTSLLAKIKITPEKREDYIDAGRVFIAKSLIVILIVIVIAVPLLAYYFVWPWLVSKFFTAKLYVGQPKIEQYNGKVKIFYEEKLENLMFKGRLSNGKYIGFGEEFYLNGRPKYSGNYSEGKYDGKGNWYSEDAKQVYKGDFVAGKKSGKGQIFQGDKLFYEGDMKDDKRAGFGKQYHSDGSIAYEGAFADDVFEGEGTENYPGGNVKYKGTFKSGLYSGMGELFNEQGIKIYDGNFEKGLFNGNGRYYGEEGKLVYDGSFVNGLFDGEGKLYKNGTLFYEGSFLSGMMSGKGTLTDDFSGLKYSGPFEYNDIAFGKLFNMKVEDIYSAFISGLTEDTSQEDYFYLYNLAFGLVLKLTYANEEEPVKLVDVYTLPKEGGLMNLQGIGDLKLPGIYELGGTGGSVADGDAIFLLGVEPGNMISYKAIYAGYQVCYWTRTDTGDVAMIEYYPSEKKLSGNAKQGTGTTGKSIMGNDPKKYAIYFEDLGLDMKDFASIGY